MGLFNNLVSFYAVSDKDKANSTKDGKYFYTIVSTKTQAIEYITRLAISERAEHFIQWCELHEKDKKSFNVMTEYLLSINCDIFQKYDIGKVRYTPENLAVIIRMFSNCMPLGCSYECDFEMSDFINKHGELNG